MVAQPIMTKPKVPQMFCLLYYTKGGELNTATSSTIIHPLEIKPHDNIQYYTH